MPLRIVRKTFVAALLLIITLAGSPAASSSQPPDPRPRPPTGNCVLDNIFYGATPPNGDELPVLVFVHGLAGLAEDWWSDQTYVGANQMYERAYEARFRTAFVNLNVDEDTPANCVVERRPANDNYTNGQVLREQLDAITQYYNVDKVDIIAHSKGGIDSQTAIVWSGAWSKVHKLITLGTPHQGSILVDQLWSPEGSWLAAILGQLDDATYALQTPVMQDFRDATDPATVDDQVHYYVGAGNFWDLHGMPMFRLTGNWLQNHPDGGDNDAIVTVASTALPGAEEIFLEPWTHIELYMGQNAWPLILPHLSRVIEAPTSVELSGPAWGVVGVEYYFTAVTNPNYATTPLSYTWQATDLNTLQVQGGPTDTRRMGWEAPGLKAVRVIVSNEAGVASVIRYVQIVPENVEIYSIRMPLALRGSAPGAQVAPAPAPRASHELSNVLSQSMPLKQIVRGGKISGPLIDRIPIEPGARSASISLLTSQGSATAALYGPDGATYPLQPVSTEGSTLFEGAFAWQADLKDPQPGEWRLHVDGPEGSAYYAVLTLDSDLHVSLDGFPTRALAANDIVRLQAAAGQNGSLVTEVELNMADAAPGYQDIRTASVSAAGPALSYPVREPGVHGATVRVRGMTADGFPFERTYSRSLLVGDGRAPDDLRSLASSWNAN
jgi:pimeloyl-ACP methyl ester carboxylesterase